MAKALRVERRGECCVVARNSAAWGRFFVKAQAVGVEQIRAVATLPRLAASQR